MFNISKENERHTFLQHILKKNIEMSRRGQYTEIQNQLFSFWKKKKIVPRVYHIHPKKTIVKKSSFQFISVILL